MRYSQDVSGFACGFVHKRILGAAGGFLGGGPMGAVGGFLGGGGVQSKKETALARTQRRGPPATSRRPAGSSCWQWTGTRWGWMCEAGDPGTITARSFGPAAPRTPQPSRLSLPGCIPPWREDPNTGKCKLFVGSQPGPNGQGAMGSAVAGAFGMPAIVPEASTRKHLTCPPGMVLGDDELCYPKAVLRRDSRFRKWRPGRRPVLTGGDLSAISKAKRAVTRGRAVMSDLGVTVKKKC